ncbi:MAG: tRNA (N6-threonylcarbamoyladenosine(37)-N6)-methyltransferase TrmO, partial [Desulfatitalea sp.]|nr:tRNA (N6-threonylcarbamoyladenosine(37)-N6)-methyltransferase TrmO [Desulfatitalea sp.]NNK01793.1 tRNA (N6-threonylcarbamoyladenosine(37)-N6)-methyltransferase TrmO [Desulfatitalea sp.]
VLEIVPPYAQPEAFRGLDAFSHVWLIFVFHGLDGAGWRPTVRPPRLGGNRRIGVFASRSGYRPNPIGQSVVRLLNIEYHGRRTVLQLGGVDLLDGTPVLDIKPYLPYADAVAAARAGYAQEPPHVALDVTFCEPAETACRALDSGRYPQLRELIISLIGQDPRPAYRQSDGAKTYGVRLWDLNIRFTVSGTIAIVESIEPRP